jgi:hypothetical protein
MKFAKKLSFSLSLAAALALSAHAQDAKVKVTLPHDAQIGDAILPAGSYNITLSMEGITVAMITPADHAGPAVFALPVSTSDYAACAASSVGLERDGGAWSIRSICFAEPQTALYFAVPMTKAVAAATPTAMAPGR